METAMKATAKGKVPNIDGYGIELLQTFWSELLGPLLRAISYSLKAGKLCNMAHDSYISFLPKKSNLNHISGWRGLNILTQTTNYILKWLMRDLNWLQLTL